MPKILNSSCQTIDTIYIQNLFASFKFYTFAGPTVVLVVRRYESQWHLKSLHVNSHLRYVKSFAKDFRKSINWKVIGDALNANIVSRERMKEWKNEKMKMNENLLLGCRSGAGRLSVGCRSKTTNSRRLFGKRDAIRKKLYFSPEFPTECFPPGI